MIRGWPLFVSAYEELHAKLDAIESVRPSEDGDDGYRGRMLAPERADDVDRVRKAAREVVVRFVRLAERRFAQPGLRLTIDTHRYLERFTTERRHNDARGELDALADFSPAAVWQQLESDFGCGAGAREALAQAAKALLRALGLNYRHSRDRIKTTARGVEFMLYLRHEAYRSRSDGYALSYHSAETVAELHRGLSGFFQWLADEHGEDVSGERAGLLAVLRLRDCDRRYRSRERVAGGSSWHLTMYKDHGMLALEGARAAQLNLFLSLHGGLEDQDAA